MSRTRKLRTLLDKNLNGRNKERAETFCARNDVDAMLAEVEIREAVALGYRVGRELAKTGHTVNTKDFMNFVVVADRRLRHEHYMQGSLMSGRDILDNPVLKAIQKGLTCAFKARAKHGRRSCYRPKRYLNRKTSFGFCWQGVTAAYIRLRDFQAACNEVNR